MNYPHLYRISIYLQKSRYTPQNVFSWIKDLPAFHSDINSTIINNLSSSSLIEKDNVFDKKLKRLDSLRTENKVSYETEANIYDDDNDYNYNLKLKDD